ncbi:MAG: outer membrane beta-barrel protein [Chromatiales bacterium]|nr:outer membrane beta-barrel protein [Chromatiales bacterium]
MKTKTLAIAVAVAAGLAATGAAQAAGKIYVGAKFGLLDYNESGFDNAFSVGGYGGYNLLGKDAHWDADLAGGTLAVEGEVTLTAIQGDTDFSGDWSMTSFGAYAAYRQPLTDSFYLKGKLGLVSYDVETDFPVTVPGVDTGRETALSAGIGAGWKVGPGNIEAELTTHEGNVLFISAGFHMNF